MGSVDPGAAGHRHAALRADRGHDDQGGDGDGGLRAPHHAGRRRGRSEAQHAVRCRGWAHSAPEEGVAHHTGCMLMVGAVVLSNGAEMLLVGSILVFMHNVGHVMREESIKTYI